MKANLFALILVLMCFSAQIIQAAEKAPQLPDNSEGWLDGKALQWSDLKGKVVLLNVWTFACWNSYRSLPWIVSLQQKFPDLQIIGIHTPEFAYEKDRDKLRESMRNNKAHYPQVLDDQYFYWNKLNNRYWPSFYVVDKEGNIRGRFSGETHAGDSQASEIEKLIETVSKES